jgi:protein-S-isoprenylcysteine O-methyltransferase Ste14
MLRLLGYIWAVFGAYWVIFAPALASKPLRKTQKLRFAFLALTFLLLLWKAPETPAVWIMVLGLAWTILALYWVAPKTDSRSREHGVYRILRLLIGTSTFSLLFWQKTGLGFLGARFVPRNLTITIFGFFATLLGLAIAAWARVHLGRYWSDKVAIQADHKLIRTGPYARMRHPIYSGVLLGIAGTAIVVGEWRALFALVLMTVNYLIKAKREDHILADRFGEEFREYERDSGMLLPQFWKRAVRVNALG